MIFVKDMNDAMPIGIQIELLFCHKSMRMKWLSPFTCAYYLQFLCYHAMHQLDNRERALQQLIDAVHDVKQCGNEQFTSLNIAGHCLLLAGKLVQARDMFYQSYLSTIMLPFHHEQNSAVWYLKNCF